jgi:hypothetical protein
MHYLTVFIFASLFLLSASPTEAQRVIYYSPDYHYSLSIDKDVLAIKDNKKHILSSSVIKGIFEKFARSIGIHLNGFARISLDKKILSPNYNIKKDKHNYFCHECRGRFEAFVPFGDISKIIFKKYEIAEIHLRSKDTPMYAYVCGLEVSGKENLGSFGRGEFKARLERTGDEIVFPDIQAAKIKSESDITAAVNLKDGTKRRLSDFRYGTLKLETNGSKISPPIEKIRIIRSIADPKYSNVFHCSVQLRTGEEKKFKIVDSFGIAGKGQQWYEFIPWENIESIIFDDKI